MSRLDELVEDGSNRFFLTAWFFRSGYLAIAVLIFLAIVVATVAWLFSFWS